MGVQLGEIKKARRAHAPERQWQKTLSSTDTMDTGKGQYITMNIVDHALEL